MKKIILPVLITVFVLTASRCSAEESVIGLPIIDSAMTLEEALEGLSPNCPVEIKNNQTLVDVQYYSMDGQIHQGQVIIDRRVAQDIAQVFEVMLEKGFPLEMAVPTNQFDWDDDESMMANNTSGFICHRAISGKTFSSHAYGLAIDINPYLNPYIKGDVILPPGAVYDEIEPGTLTADHIIVETFLKLGWEWGGNWQSLKDYQHFEKVPEE